MNLQKIPKVELHRHLEGALRYSTVVELAKTAKKDLPFTDAEALKNMLCVTSPMKDLKSVLNKFWLTQSLLDSEEVLERITYEAIEDAYKENVQMLELRYSLSFISINHSHFKDEHINRAIYKGMLRAKKDFPVKVGFLATLGRVDEPAVQRRVMDFVVDHAETFVGVDLADNETDVDKAVLVPIYAKAKKAGLGITIHAGEAPGTEKNVVDSIELLGAQRIGHGVQIHRFPKIIDFVKSRGVHLELCPYSNWLTNAVPSTKLHPFRKLMEAGVSVSINSDDPGIFHSTLTREYEILANEHGFTESEFKKCNEMAAQASFIRF